MKYLIASLLVPAVQFAFLMAFIIFAMGFWMSSMAEKVRLQRASARVYRKRR